MDFCRTIFHVVQQGDTFYRLAQRYQTTVPDIIMRNPGVNPYNLQVGTRLRICAGYQEELTHPETLELNNDMRQSWNQHSMWTAMLMQSLLHDLENLDAVQTRLKQSPEEIAAVFGGFYPMPVTNRLKQLLEEHVRLAEELAAAMKTGNMEQTTQLENELNQNGDRIAGMLADTNAKYDYEELRRLLSGHMKLMKDSMTAELSGNHEESVRLTDENEALLMQLADALTQGLVEEFYQR